MIKGTLLKALDANRIAIGPGLVRVVAIFLELLITIILARTLSLEEMGYYQFAMSYLQIAVIVAAYGNPLFGTKYVAIYSATNEEVQLRSFVVYMIKRTILTSLLVTLITAGYVIILRDSKKIEYADIIIMSIMAIYPLAVIRLLSGVYNGLGKTVKSQLPEYIVRPLLFISVVYVWQLLYELNCVPAMNSGVAIALLTMASTIAVLIYVPGQIYFGSWCVLRSQRDIRSSSKSVISDWNRAGKHMTFIGILQALGLQADTLILAHYQPAEIVAKYKVAYMMASALGLTLTVLNISYASKFAHVYALGQIAELQKLAKSNARVGFAAIVALSAIVFSFDNVIIQAVFGNDYYESIEMLGVLVIGLFVSASTGSVGTILNMIGYEKNVMHVNAIYVVLVVLLCLISIPYYGAIGAAAASAFCLSLKNIALCYILKRREQVSSFIV